MRTCGLERLEVNHRSYAIRKAVGELLGQRTREFHILGKLQQECVNKLLRPQISGERKR